MVAHELLRPALGLFAFSALSGCVASTVASVVTAPVKVAGAAVGAAGSAVDMATTSQSEADEKRGRDMRKREERLGQLDREYRKQSEKCAAGDADACARRDAAYAEMEQLRPTVPVPNTPE